MLQLAGSVTLMLAVVVGAAIWVTRTNNRDRIENGGRR